MHRFGRFAGKWVALPLKAPAGLRGFASSPPYLPWAATIQPRCRQRASLPIQKCLGSRTALKTIASPSRSRSRRTASRSHGSVADTRWSTLSLATSTAMAAPVWFDETVPTGKVPKG